MPGDLCGAIRFAGLAAEGTRGIAAEGHRNALAGLLPEIRAVAADLAAHYVTGSPAYGRPLPDLDALLEDRGLAERYAGVLDAALARAASEERAELARVVAEDAKAASWMSAASFFNTIAHRTGLFQAAAHNIPGVSLPPPSLEQWAPAADAAVKGLTTALVRSHGYQPMQFSSAAGGDGGDLAALAAAGAVAQHPAAAETHRRGQGFAVAGLVSAGFVMRVNCLVAIAVVIFLVGDTRNGLPAFADAVERGKMPAVGLTGEDDAFELGVGEQFARHDTCGQHRAVGRHGMGHRRHGGRLHQGCWMFAGARNAHGPGTPGLVDAGMGGLWFARRALPVGG